MFQDKGFATVSRLFHSSTKVKKGTKMLLSPRGISFIVLNNLIFLLIEPLQKVLVTHSVVDNIFTKI